MNSSSLDNSLCPWNSPGKNTRVGYCSLLQGIFPTQGSNLGLPCSRQILYHWATKEALITKNNKKKETKKLLLSQLDDQTLVSVYMNAIKGNGDYFSKSYVTPTKELIWVICAQLINLGSTGLGILCPLVIPHGVIHMCIFVGKWSITSTILLIFLNQKC